MFFRDLADIDQIARRAHFSIIILPADLIAAHLPQTKQVAAKNPNKTTSQLPALKPALDICPDPTRGKIYIDQVRAVTALLTTQQPADFFVVFWQADTLNPEAQNAFLKNLEEPGANYHFVFYTAAPSALLPTVLSRAQIYYWQTAIDPTAPPTADPKSLALAKQLIAARPRDLPILAETFHKKPQAARRTFALQIVALSIEILQKSFLKTGNPRFLTKLTKFLQLYANLAAGGHVKLHLVADLL